MNKYLPLLALLVVYTATQSCDMSQDLRTDCGYMGINQQQCEGKGCCWKPASEDATNDIPWCFFPSGSNPCEKMRFSWSGGMGFDDAFWSQMYPLF